MIGRDLIIYILENHLEDKPVFDNGRPIGYMSIKEAAVKFDVGLETIKIWYELGVISGIVVNDVLYIPYNVVKKEEKT